MTYVPVSSDAISPSLPKNGDSIEVQNRYDPEAYPQTPSPGYPPDRAFKYDGDDAKPLVPGDSRSKQPELPEREWNVQAQRVAIVTPLRAAIMVYDAALASTPIMFIALAIVAARLDGKEISDYGGKLKEALLLTPTIFPLIFAALMGRFFRHLGGYLAERGTTLGRLEQLIGCQSVFTALERQFTLHSWSIVGLVSILVWLLSPVGGQSALRLFGEENKSVLSYTTVRFLDPQVMKQSALRGPSSFDSGRATFTSIFLAALLSSSKYQATPMDLWGNVKLPLYREIENATSSEWKPAIDRSGKNATYGSLIGIPTTGVPTEGLSDFSIRARQFDVKCSRNELKSGQSSERLFANMTSTWEFFNDESKDDETMYTNYPIPMLSVSQAGDPEKPPIYSVAACDINLNYLEANVKCNGTACAVDSIRRLDLFGDGYERADDDVTRVHQTINLMNLMASIDNYKIENVRPRGSTNTEKWMANPNNFIGATYDREELYKLDVDTFSRRLTILCNTFYQSTYATTALGGALPMDLVQTGVLRGYPYDTTFNETQASVQQTHPVYRTDWKWFTALLVCSLILLAAAYAGLVLKYIALAPDIIGYASSLAMHNPYVPTPMGGTTLNGLERAALLYDVPVRIGDVCPNDPLGVIAFARADEGVGRLSKGKLYI